MAQIPAHVARKLTDRAAFVAATVDNLLGMAERAIAAGEHDGARAMLDEVRPYVAEHARFVAAGWSA